MKRLGFALVAAFALTALGGSTASAKPPGLCDGMYPQVQQHQIWSDDVQDKIDIVGDRICP